MKSLQTIQKTFRVFQILAKIAFVFSIVGASICAVGALCAVTWYSGGTVFRSFRSREFRRAHIFLSICQARS